ncbi:MAG: zinc ribbon domain-containing protein [Promethearchaeota archaeon]
MLNTLNKKILVAFFSKYGYIKEITEFISTQFKENGLQVDLLDLRKPKRNKWPSLNDYKGVIIGSSKTLYRFWHRTVKKFVKDNIYFLINHYKIVGFFLSDPNEALILLDPIECDNKFKERIIKNFKFLPDFYLDFGPVLDFSKRSKLNYDERRDLRQNIKLLLGRTSIKIDYNGFNDFRDWDKVRNFTLNFLNILIEGKKCNACGKVIAFSAVFCTNCGIKLEIKKLI